MVRQPLIRRLKHDEAQEYDLFVATIGYESRARYIVEKLTPRASRLLAIGFTSDQIFHYHDNSEWFKSQGYVVEHVSDEHFPKVIVGALRDACNSEPQSRAPIRIGVDISSETRFRLAVILKSIESYGSERSIHVDFLYAVAAFSPPPAVTEANTHVGPVLPSMSGWWAEPERPIAALVGLGYEENKALGAVEHIQVSSIFTFTPRSPIEAYSPAVDEANRTLLQQVPRENRFVYDVDRPMDTFVELESFTFGVTRAHNLVVLPFGPKIFALCAMLIGIIHPEVAVWRVSGKEEKVDRTAAGEVYGLGVNFGDPG